MKFRWLLKPKPPQDVIQHLIKEVNTPKALATILAQRGFDSFSKAKEFFRPQLSALHNPFLMKDMERAVERISKAINNQENILVYGDYDVDGVTSVSLVFDFLKTIYPNVHYYIPNRYNEGYGISTQGIDFAHDNNFGLIIALDCGIKANKQVDYAQHKNIDFIICDHHLPSEKLPNAIAVLDPKRKDCPYPFKELSGCGVGFKLIQALNESLQLNINVFNYLDLVAISIAADIVAINDENRILMYYGLKQLRTTPRIGIKNLIPIEQKKHLTVSDIVFSIAPKINAAGRIENATQAVELLVTKSESNAQSFTQKINALNNTRKETDENVTIEAIQQIIKNKEEHNASTVVYNPNWHKGVLGIVASRLIETYHRPTLVFTNGNIGERVASARSVKNFNVYDVIDDCSDLLERYGGHKYAAGLTLKEENYQAFKNKFENLVGQKILQSQKTPTLEIDYTLDFNEIDPKFLNILKQMAPFGPENMTPLFLSENLIADEFTVMGKDKNHLRLAIHQKNTRVKFNAVGFKMGDLLDDLKTKSFDAVYSIEENHWKGNSYLQLNLRDVRFKN